MNSEPLPLLSPGSWTPPAGVLPGWNWVPPDGVSPRIDLAPWWVRVWYRVPFVDRYAYVWMWHHGCWQLDRPADSVDLW